MWLELEGVGIRTTIRIFDGLQGERVVLTFGLGGLVATTRLEEDVLRKIAAGTHGEYSRVTSGKELRQTLNRLGLRGGKPPGSPESFSSGRSQPPSSSFSSSGRARLTGRRFLTHARRTE